MEAEMHLSVDRKACAGSGFCERIAPALFRIDESNAAEVLLPVVPAELQDAAREAEDTCPTNAIETKE